MDDGEFEWIIAGEARMRLRAGRSSDREAEDALNRRIGGGLIRLRCQRLIYESPDGRFEHDDIEPRNFPYDLFAEAEPLTVVWDWQAGDLSWRHPRRSLRHRVQAFGVQFAEADIEKLIPATLTGSAGEGDAVAGTMARSRISVLGAAAAKVVPIKIDSAQRDEECRRVAALLDAAGISKRRVRASDIAERWDPAKGEPLKIGSVTALMAGGDAGRPRD